MVPEYLQQRQQPDRYAPVDLQVRAQPTMRGLRQVGRAVKQGQHFPESRYTGRLASGQNLFGGEVQFFLMLPSPHDEGFGLRVQTLTPGRQALLQPLQRC